MQESEEKGKSRSRRNDEGIWCFVDSVVPGFDVSRFHMKRNWHPQMGRLLEGLVDCSPQSPIFHVGEWMDQRRV